MAFREKTAWISVVSMLAVYGYYFARVWREPGGPFLGLLTGCVVVLVIIQIVLNIVAAIAAPRDARAPQDERDRLFMLRGYRSAYFVLASSALAAVAAELFGLDRYAIVNGLFFALIVAEMARVTTLIVHYRRDS